MAGELFGREHALRRDSYFVVQLMDTKVYENAKRGRL